MKITLVPYAGLCNRLYAIAGGIAFKEQYPETDLKILWYKYWHCNCRYKDLFKQLPKKYTPVNELTYQINNIPGHRFNLNIPQLFRRFWYDCWIIPGDSRNDFEKITKGKSRLYVYHDNEFCDIKYTGKLSDLFIPVDDLKERIQEITNDWKGNVVGLHIRRTDNKEAITQSPMNHFYEVIEKEILLDKTVRFYLATDDEAVKNDLKSRYGDKIITINLTLKRNSLQGMKDAVVDLYCLGATKKIYGSTHSTYSMFAAQLHKIDLIL